MIEVLMFYVPFCYLQIKYQMSEAVNHESVWLRCFQICMFSFSCGFSWQYHCNWLTGKIHLQNGLFCVEWDVWDRAYWHSDAKMLRRLVDVLALAWCFSADSSTASLTNVCNVNCSCAEVLYEPICSHNGLQYYSPCHAGCLIQENTAAATV